MEKKLSKVTHQGTLKILGRELPCAVLEDGTRILTQKSFYEALGRTARGQRKKYLEEINIPGFIDAKNLRPFIDKELLEMISPVAYLNEFNRKKKGYRAEALPLVCDVYLQARKEGILTSQQLPFAEVCEIIVRSLSKVGIVALVDEATGYQKARARNALEKLLELYIAKELLPWAKKFPDEFYEELFRLKGWQFIPFPNKKPRVVGKITNDIVYKRLPEGVLEELQSKNPSDEKGYRKHKHHQYLTTDIGNVHLEKHLASVIILMRASVNWRGFKRLLDRACPITHLQLDMFEEAGMFEEKEL